MRQITTTFCAALVLLACNNEKTKTEEPKVASSTTEKPAEPATTVMPDSAAMMKAWNDYMTPGASHKMLASWSGEWEGEATDYSNPQSPQKSRATTSSKMIMGGRYQQMMYKGTSWGMPFEGMSLMGYDNTKKVFVSTWIDNMGTGVMKMEGPWDEATKTLTLKGTMIDPIKNKECEMREVFKVIDEKNHLLEMYGQGPDGKEMKFMEVTFKKKG